MAWCLLLPFFLQGLAMIVDELYFHRRRGLPRWERVGHPLDTLTVMACFGFILLTPFSYKALKIYAGLAVFSSLFITKDEFVHTRYCSAAEHWLHAFLFILHPAVLLVGAAVWPLFHTEEAMLFRSLHPASSLLRTAFIVQVGVVCGFFLYQVMYWNPLWPKPHEHEMK